jgi:hypothetical protein
MGRAGLEPATLGLRPRSPRQLALAGRGDADDAQTFLLQEAAHDLEERFIVVDDQ